MAESLSQKGNNAYKSGDLIRAQKFYAEASKLDPSEPKFLLNLSAAQYEAGQYSECIHSIVQAWMKIDSKDVQDVHGPWESLRLKLATRFYKANIHQYQSSCESPPFASAPLESAGFDQDNTKIWEAIESYASNQDASTSDLKSRDLVEAWKHWKQLLGSSRLSPSDRRQERAAAEKRFRALPIFKWTSDPILELYSFGHDNVLSLVRDLDNKPGFPPLRLEKLTSEERSGCISFLFGGSGDARHVFGTLVDIANKLSNDIRRKRQIPKIHFTLIDVQTVPLARVLIVLELLRRISKSQGLKERMELETALCFLYVSIVLPDYCNEIIMDIARHLVTVLSQNPSESLPKWLHVHQESIPAIIDTLDYWSNPLPKSTQSFVEFHDDLVSFTPDEAASRLIEALPTESLFDEHLKIISPPEQLLDRHPVLSKLATASRPSSALLKAAKKEVWTTWKPNPTLFDKYSTEHPDLNHPGGYPRIGTTAREVAFALVEFNVAVTQHPQFPYGAVLVSFVAEFFRGVTKAIAGLKNNLTFEFVHADVISGVPKLVRGELGERPPHFPAKFQRTWLSNVPDYTHGFLDTILYLLPHHSSKTSDALSPLVMSNCLWNTGAFRSLDEFCYTYTLLDHKELERFLSCRLILSPTPSFEEEKMWLHHILLPLPLPRPSNELASKAELSRWLSYLLLCTISNAKPRPPPQRIDLPNNLNPFFRLLVYLHEVGYPAHWLAEFLQNVVFDTLVTEMRPYEGLLPIPTAAGKHESGPTRKVHLKAWQMELETILATIGPALPFHVKLPEGFSPLHDVHKYRACVEEIDLRQCARYAHLGPLVSPFTKNVGLIFYKPNPSLNVDEVAKGVSRSIEGDPAFAEVQFILGATKIDLPKGIVEWRMSTRWYQRMKEEEWKLAAYRTDLRVAVTQPTSIDKWEDVEGKWK